MSTRLTPSIRTLGLLAAAAVTIAGASRSAMAIQPASTTVVVTSSNLDGWAFNSNNSNGDVITDSDHIGGFATGPATPPLGTGSAELKIINGAGDGSEQLRNSSYAGTPLSSITSLSYSTYDVTNNGQQFPYLTLAVSSQGDGVYDDALFFEPPYQTPATGSASLPDQGVTALTTWQTWNALAGGWWSNNGDLNPGTGVGTLADYLLIHPNATIVNPDTSLGGVRLSVGYSSIGDNYEGYVDNMTIGVGGVATTFDFEASAAAPEPASLSALALGGIALLARRRRNA